MVLAEGQFQLRGLVMGPGTPYTVAAGTNPFSRVVRADQSGQRAWNHGSWSGAEWMDEAVVPFRIVTNGAGLAGWLAAHQALMAAFAPVGETAEDLELRFALGGAEYVMFGRPRMVDPETGAISSGKAVTRAAFVATDPLIYSAEEQSETLGLPSFTGGLTIPVQVPFTVPGVLVGGKATITNDGTADTPLGLRIDGPVREPRVTLQRNDGLAQSLQVMFDLAAGQWVDIDTGAHTVLLNGVANRRGQVTGEFPTIPPGESTLRFQAATFNDEAELTARYRHAWW